MSFLYAWAIALGLGVVVPLILHLRRRHTDRRVSFPALRYLSSAEDARSRSIVASDVLLLAIRMALLVALALAAAGPLLGRGGARDHTPTDVALIVDNSASTSRLSGDRAVFEDIRERALAALDAARPEDRIWVFPTVGPPPAGGVGAARAAEAVGRIPITDGAADLAGAVARATAALPADEGREREVHLLSDLQAAAFPTDAGTADGEIPLVVWVPPPLAEPNSAVTRLDLTGGTTVPSGVGHGVLARTSRFGAEADSAGDASVRLQVDGRIAAAARAPWGATASLGLPELGPGAHDGRVEVDPGGARADDVRYFSILVVSPPAVLFSGPPESFLAIGIETLLRAGRLSEGAGASVAVVEGAGSGPTPWGSAATVVFVPPADPVDLPAFNQRLASLGVGWQAQADASRGDLGLDEPGAAFSLRGVRVRSRVLLRPTGGGGGAADSTLLTTEDGEPWLVRTRAGDRLVLLLGSPMTVEASDLPAHPAVIPFLEALLVHWSHLAAWPPGDFAAGTPVTVPVWAETVTAPDGTEAPVEGGAPFRPARAGVYRVTGTDADGAPAEARFAVNVPASEIDPRPLAVDRLEELFPTRPVFTAGPDAGDWDDAVYRARRGRDAAPWLLALALALIVAELVLATPGRSGRSRDIDAAQPRSETASRVST